MQSGNHVYISSEGVFAWNVHIASEHQIKYGIIQYEIAQHRWYGALRTQISLRWRHNDHAGVSNHQPHDCLLNRLFRRKSKKTSKLRVTGLCAGNSTGTGEFPAQMASYAENVSIWWRHHDDIICVYIHKMKLPSFRFYSIFKIIFSVCLLVDLETFSKWSNSVIHRCDDPLLCEDFYISIEFYECFSRGDSLPRVRGFWSWFGGVCSLTYCNGNFRVTMVSEPFNVIL